MREVKVKENIKVNKDSKKPFLDNLLLRFNIQKFNIDKKIDLYTKQAKDALANKRYLDAIFNYDKSIELLYSKKSKTDSDSQKLIYALKQIAVCYDALNEPLKSLEYLEEKSALLNSVNLRNDYKMSYMLYKMSYMVKVLNDSNIKSARDAYLLTSLEASLDNLKVLDISNDCKFQNVKDVVEFFYANISKGTLDINEPRVNLVCANVYKILDEKFKHISDKDRRYIKERILSCDLSKLLIDKNEAGLVEMLNKAKEDDDVLTVSKVINTLYEYYLHNTTLDLKTMTKIEELFGEPYFYIYDKINDTKETNDDLSLYLSFFEISKTAIDFYVQIYDDWNYGAIIAEKYFHTLQNVLESNKAEKTLGAEFSKIILGDSVSIREAYRKYPDMLKDYYRVLVDIKGISKQHGLNSKLKSQKELNTISSSIEEFLSILKDDNLDECVNLALDVFIGLAIEQNKPQAKEILNSIKPYLPYVGSLEVKAKYLYGKMYYNSEFKFPESELNSEVTFKKLLKLCDQSQNVYNKFYRPALNLMIGYYINRGEYYRADEYAEKLLDYIEEKGLLGSIDEIDYLSDKKIIYRALGFMSEYVAVSERLKNLRLARGDDPEDIDDDDFGMDDDDDSSDDFDLGGGWQ